MRVVAYDLSEPEVVGRLEKLKKKLRIIIDDSKEHGEADSGETQAAKRAREDGGRGQCQAPAHEEPSAQQDDHRQRQEDEEGRVRVDQLSWRGLYVQANNAFVVEGKKAVDLALAAFDNYFDNEDQFEDTASAKLTTLGLDNIDAKVAFSPHSASNALLADRRRHRRRPPRACSTRWRSSRSRPASSRRRSRRSPRRPASSSTASPTRRSVASTSRCRMATSRRCSPRRSRRTSRRRSTRSRPAAAAIACTTSSS